MTHPRVQTRRLDGQQPAPDLKKDKDRNTLLKNVPVTGINQVTGATETGTLTVTRFAYDQATGKLLVSGTYTNANGTDTFEDAEVQGLASAPTAPVCPILDLDIGAIHLDVLGLVIDLAPIHLDIVAVSGPGRLLGNLLCALVGLLDRVPRPLADILDLIDRINRLLG